MITVLNWMAPISAGISIGYTSVGSIISRSFRFTVMALNNVPITVIPHVPSSITKNNSPQRSGQREL